MSTLFKRPRAEQDLLEIWLYIAADNPEKADEVLDAIDLALQLLAQTPTLGTQRIYNRSELATMRMCPVPRFRHYLIFYQPLPDRDGIEVIRVLHGSRDLPALF